MTDGKKRGLQDYAELCHQIARDKGFWDSPRNTAEMLMLVVSELSEALEADRRGDADGFREEIADTFIRLFDLCGGFEIDIEAEIEKKRLKNQARPYKHGKKY
ncbi:hypothetical protein HY522_09340 [bacterium]|nr:hypothetical protein [bacterium]